MRRNIELIRELMLALETASGPMTDSFIVPGRSRDEVAYHLALIHAEGFAEGPRPVYYADNVNTSIPGAVILLRMTPAGHDFLDAVRSNTVWKKTSERIAAVGGSVTLQVIQQVAVSSARQLLGLAD